LKAAIVGHDVVKGEDNESVLLW